MLPKFFVIPKRTPSFFRGKKPAASATPSVFKEDNVGLSAVLKIIHVGGTAEFYYMAVPAISIMNKYPSFLLARPEIFRRPWDSLVHPAEILMPGERYFVVPKRTVKKLQRRIPQVTDILRHGSTESSTSWQSSSRSSGMSKSKSHKDDSISTMMPTSRHSKRSRKKKSHKAVRWDPKLTIIHEGSHS